MNNINFTTDESKRMDNPFSGIATFMRAPYADQLDHLDADIAVLGMPYDMGTAVRAGARFGPRAIRDVSTWNAYLYHGWYNPLDDEVYMDENWKVVDVGDVDVLHTEYQQSFLNCETAIRKIVSQGVIPFTMGGDHAITTPILKGFDSFQDLCVIQIDAHLDFTYAPRFGNVPYRPDRSDRYARCWQFSVQRLGRCKSKRQYYHEYAGDPKKRNGVGSQPDPRQRTLLRHVGH